MITWAKQGAVTKLNGLPVDCRHRTLLDSTRRRFNLACRPVVVLARLLCLQVASTFNNSSRRPPTADASSRELRDPKDPAGPPSPLPPCLPRSCSLMGPSRTPRAVTLSSYTQMSTCGSALQVASSMGPFPFEITPAGVVWRGGVGR